MKDRSLLRLVKVYKSLYFIYFLIYLLKSRTFSNARLSMACFLSGLISSCADTATKENSRITGINILIILIQQLIHIILNWIAKLLLLFLLEMESGRMILIGMLNQKFQVFLEQKKSRLIQLDMEVKLSVKPL